MELKEVILSKRLLLRKFKPEDWRDIHDYLSDEKVVHFEPYGPFSEEESKDEAVCRSKNEEFIAVCLKETGKVIGNLYFGERGYETYELGYVFNSDYWHKGYASESAKALMDYAFKSGKVRRIIAACNPKNVSSWHLLERLNMRREGHLRENIYFKTDSNNKPLWQDTFVYGILALEWKVMNIDTKPISQFLSAYQTGYQIYSEGIIQD